MSAEQNNITEKKTRCIMTGKPVEINVKNTLFAGKGHNKYWVHLFMELLFLALFRNWIEVSFLKEDVN